VEALEEAMTTVADCRRILNCLPSPDQAQDWSVRAAIRSGAAVAAPTRLPTAKGGHAALLVGYTPATFIVRNSWGTTSWGDEGYGHASLAYARHAFTEAYGVTL
jgi:hypothetical protein